MTVLILERVSPGLRGYLSRWMLEPKAGVFVGTLSAMVRDKLWEESCRKAGVGACLLIHSAATEQGFAMKAWNAPSRWIEDFEGLTLVRIPKSKSD